MARVFLSTPSARRATLDGKVIPISQYISIHALREEGDWEDGAGVITGNYFYPRPPRGGRRLPEHISRVGLFISIHALREEGDSKNREKIPAFGLV